MTKDSDNRFPGILAVALPAVVAALACSPPPAEPPAPEETAAPATEDRDREVVLRP